MVGFVWGGVIVGRVCVGQVHHREGFDWVGFIVRRIWLRLVSRVCRDEFVVGLGLSRGEFVWGGFNVWWVYILGWFLHLEI